MATTRPTFTQKNQPDREKVHVSKSGVRGAAKYAVAPLLCIGAAFLLLGCGTLATAINNRREQQTLIIARDLRANAVASKYYKPTNRWAPVPGTPVSIITSKPMSASFYGWPLGPRSIVDIATEEWTYAE